VVKNMNTAKSVEWKGHKYPVYRDTSVFKEWSSIPTCPFCSKNVDAWLIIEWRQYGIWRDVVIAALQCSACERDYAVRTFIEFVIDPDEVTYEAHETDHHEVYDRDGFLQSDVWGKE